MTPEERNRIVAMLPRGHSFMVWNGVHVHTCTYPPEHPAYTDTEHCGKCWMECNHE